MGADEFRPADQLPSGQRSAYYWLLERELAGDRHAGSIFTLGQGAPLGYRSANLAVEAIYHAGRGGAGAVFARCAAALVLRGDPMESTEFFGSEDSAFSRNPNASIAPLLDKHCARLSAKTGGTIAKLYTTGANPEGNDTLPAQNARRLGEDGLFELLVEGNRELLLAHDVGTIVASSPHCVNTFKNEYGERAFEVVHYSQHMATLLDEGRLTFKGRVEKRVTYHDPCFLGKHNGIYDEPRRVLDRIPGLDFVEMDRSRESALCCEGGGGRMWVEASDEGQRLAEIRIRDAVEMGAEILATACPFCLLTLEDALKTTGNEEKLRVMDIAEILVEALNH